LCTVHELITARYNNLSPNQIVNLSIKNPTLMYLSLLSPFLYMSEFEEDSILLEILNLIPIKM